MKRRTISKKILVLLLILSLLMAFAFPVFAEEQEESRQTSWMGDVNGELTLAQFTIPGTHDSCTNKCIVGRCQFVGVEEQLNMGVRFLDIRLKAENQELHCYHSFIDCDITFAYVVKTVENFLREHPSECVVMSIKNEGDSSAEFEEVLVNQWIDADRYDGLWYTAENIPTLDSVRGKIVLMRRYINYDPDLARGLDASDHWEDNATFIMEQEGYAFAIQDNYQYNTGGLKFGKWKWQAFHALDKAISLNDPYNREDLMWLNFSSGCNKIGCGQLSCAVVVNENLRQNLMDAKGNHGIVIMDYVDSVTVEIVFSTNF